MALYKFYAIILDRQAQKFLDKLSEIDSDSIEEKIQMLVTDEFGLLDVKKLQGYDGHYRIRVGQHRIVFVVVADKKIIMITVIERRNNVYQILQKRR